MSEEKEKKKKCKCGCDHENCECENGKDHECCNNKEEKKCKKDHKKNEKFLKEIEELKTSANLWEEKCKYAQAELINYRKRKDEEVTTYKRYAHQDIITDLIPIIDNFERAIKHDDHDLTDELSKFLDGFKMMYASLVEILRNYGVEEISRVGEVFDPNLEEALMTDNLSDMEDDVVTEVLLKGYKLNDRVIRPASVKINKKEGENNE